MYWLLTENYVLNANILVFMLIHTELFSNVSGFGLEKNFGPWPRPWPHSFWPRPRPWPHAQLASLTSLVDLRHAIDSEVHRNLAYQNGTTVKNDNLRLPPYILLTLGCRFVVYEHQSFYAIDVTKNRRLSTRQHVCHRGEQSAPSIVQFGVPQGSVQGPLLFVMYTTDVVNIVERQRLSAHQYADDIQVYIAGVAQTT